MRRLLKTVFLPATFALLVSCAGEQPDAKVAKAYPGLVINEIAAHEEHKTDSWVEIMNTSSKEVSLSGLGLYATDQYLDDKCIWSSSGGTLAPGGRLVVSTADESMVTSLGSYSEFSLRLGTEKGSVDKFVRSTDCCAKQYKRGSFQRIPDGTGSWRNFTFSSKGKENVVFDLNAPKRTAIWTWSSHMAPLMENDAAIMKDLWRKGYRHLLLNSAAFTNRPQECAVFMDKAEEIGFIVHAWIQAFYNGGWELPIDKETKKMKEFVYTSIHEKGRIAIEDFGVKGIHLDYIRWPNNALSYNFTKEVNSVAAVNRACREVREQCDGYDEGLVTSAALMPEKNSTNTYAQDPSIMGKYLHILMPMCYRYSYNYSDAGLVSVMNWFCDNSADAEVWSGMQTYDKSETPLSTEAILADATVYAQSKATGVVLFRYGLGTFPDMNTLYSEGY
jgi:hypothetical protein